MGLGHRFNKEAEIDLQGAADESREKTTERRQIRTETIEKGAPRRGAGMNGPAPPNSARPEKEQI